MRPEHYMAPESNHLIVEKGPDSGRKILIPAGGARAGRSSNNDIVLNDPAMSRFHCRFFFKPGAGLWAEDLGSANQTLLNDHPLSASALQVGDRLLMGDTLLQVLNVEEPMPDLFSAAAPPSGSIAFRRRGGGERPAGRQRLALWGGGLLLVAAGLIVVSGIFRSAPLSETPVTNHTRLEIAYEKVQANSNNIFRYQMRLSDNELSIQIDDLQTRRHVLGNQRKRVEAELLQSLAAALRHTGFYELKEEYLGLASDVWDLWDLTITLGQQTHRVKILNTLEPEAFRITRETIEEFGQNELGLAALALAPEKLLSLARDAVLLGRNLYDQRNIKHENLAMAIRALKEAEWYLETIEPKPDFYAEAVALRGTSERQLQDIYLNHLFLAERAIKLRDWEDAATQLRLICEKIPERSDERHAGVRKKLIDVERHLKRK